MNGTNRTFIATMDRCGEKGTYNGPKWTFGVEGNSNGPKGLALGAKGTLNEPKGRTFGA